VPFNGSGVYSAPSLPGSWNPAISGQDATPADWNTLLADISTALSTCWTTDGQSTISANQAMSGFKFTGVGDATARTQYASMGQIQDGGGIYAAAGGTADVITLTLSPVITAYAIGQKFSFKTGASANTTTVTLNVNGVGAGSVVGTDGSALAAGELQASRIVVVEVVATTPVFQIISQASTAATQAAGNSTTKVATTAFVGAAVAVAVSGLNASLRSYLAGLTLSTAGSSGTFGIATGVATDTTSAFVMSLASAYTKTTSAWAVGTGSGSLDTGAIANTTWYHVHLIRRPDTGVVDVLTSLSAMSPTLPTNYTQFRRIGSMQTNGSAQWVKFNQLGDDFYRLENLDYTLGGGTAVAALKTLSVPTGVIVEPFTTVVASAVNNNNAVVQYAPAADATLLFTVGKHYEGDAANGSSSSNSVIGPATNTSAQIYVAQPGAGGLSQYIYTYGWRDTRGRND